MKKSQSAPKTNAVRILEREHIPYELIEYDIADGLVDGVSVARKTGQAVETVFKTLVTKATGSQLFVFLLPVALELDLNKAAKAARVKKLAMLPLGDLTKETGYVRGGCSAVGMKRKHPAIIHETALNLDAIIVSAGRPGIQMKLCPGDLAKVTEASHFDICRSDG